MKQFSPQLIAIIALTSAFLFIILTMLIAKLHPGKNKSSEPGAKTMIEKTPGTELNQEPQKISIQEKQPVDMIQEEKPKVERYCYQVNGKFYWKARKNKTPNTKAPKNWDLLDPKKYLQEQEKVSKSLKDDV